MKASQELLKKSANLQTSIPPRQKLDLLRFIKARQMSRSIKLTGFQIIANNVFILKGYLFLDLYNPYRTRKTQGLWVCIILIGLGKLKVCVNLFGIREPIKLLFKRRWKRKNLTLESFIRFSFWNPSLLLQKKEFLLRFLYAFGFCNQVKSLAPTLKILLVFLCEAVANQLQ